MNAPLELRDQTQCQQSGVSVPEPQAAVAAPLHAHVLDGNRLDWSALLHEALTEPGRISAAFSVFHRYSIGNAFLLMLQASLRGVDLSPVASFKKWKELGRSVRKGEKAFEMVMPVLVKAKTKTAKGEKPADEGRKSTKRPANTRFSCCAATGFCFLKPTRSPEPSKPKWKPRARWIGTAPQRWKL